MSTALFFFLCSERGKYLALVIGGQNCQVFLSEILGPQELEMKNEIYPITGELMHGLGSDVSE